MANTNDALKRELKAAGRKWAHRHKLMTAAERRALLDELIERREMIERKRREPEPEDDIRGPLPPVIDEIRDSVGEGTAGGGRRVIRSTRGLS